MASNRYRRQPAKIIYRPREPSAFARLIKIALEAVGIAAAAAVIALLAYMLAGCTRTVYLPEDAARYRALLIECHNRQAACEDSLKECEQDLERAYAAGRPLLNCPPCP